METLLDASRAMMQDLTPADRRKPLWREAGWAVIAAVDNGDAETVCAATERLIAALESEGWMTAQRAPANYNPLLDCLAALSADLSACIAVGVKSRSKPDLRIVEGSRRPSPGDAIRRTAGIHASAGSRPARAVG